MSVGAAVRILFFYALHNTKQRHAHTHTVSQTCVLSSSIILYFCLCLKHKDSSFPFTLVFPLFFLILVIFLVVCFRVRWHQRCSLHTAIFLYLSSCCIYFLFFCFVNQNLFFLHFNCSFSMWLAKEKCARTCCSAVLPGELKGVSSSRSCVRADVAHGPSPAVQERQS